MQENIRVRKEVLLNAKEKITKEFERKTKTLDKYIEVLEKSIIHKEDSVENIAFKLYLQLDNVSNVAKTINELGFRLNTSSHIGKRKYTSNDITAIITNKDATVEEDLKEVVQEIQKMNYGKVAKRWF